MNWFFGWVLGWPMHGFYLITRSYAAATILFLILVVLLNMVIRIQRTKIDFKQGITAPYINEIKQRFNSGPVYEKASIQIYDTAKYSMVSSFAWSVLMVFLIIGTFYVLSHPLSMALRLPSTDIDAMMKTAKEVIKEAPDLSFGETYILYAIRTNPQAFADINGIATLTSLNTSFFGIDLLFPANVSSFAIVLPIIAISKAIYGFVRFVVAKIIKQWKGLKKRNLIFAALYFVLITSFIMSAFLFPANYALYYLVSSIFAFIPISRILSRKFSIQKKVLVPQLDKILESFPCPDSEPKCSEVSQ